MKKSLILIFAAIITVFISCNNLGKEIDHNRLQIFYKNGATEADALRLKDYLVKSGFESGNAQSVQITKQGGTYVFKEVLAPGVKVNSKLAQLFSEFASELSKDVFNNAKVKIHTCNNRMETLQVFDMAPDSVASGGPLSDGSLKVYDSPNYSIKYPASWQFDASGKMGTKFFMISKGATINLVTEDLTIHPLDLDAYIKASESQIKTNFTNCNILEDSRQQSNNREYQKLTYTFDQGNDKLRLEQYLWVVNDTGYVLTFGMKLAAANENVIQNGESIMESFVIK